MTLFKRLKEIADNAERKPYETLAEYADRYNSEARWVRETILPILLQLYEEV